MKRTASALTGLVGKAIERGTYCGGANSMYPAGTPSTYAILPQLPHSSSTEETQDSFSSSRSPLSSARARLTGSSSQKTHLRHFSGRSPRLSSVMLTIRRDILFPGFPASPAESTSVTGRYPVSWHDTQGPGPPGAPRGFGRTGADPGGPLRGPQGGLGGRAAPPRAGGVLGGSSPQDNRGEAVTPEP